jgi:hypothetical protein
LGFSTHTRRILTFSELKTGQDGGVYKSAKIFSKMELKPKIQPELSPVDRLIEIAGWLALSLLWIIILYSYRKLPGPNIRSKCPETVHNGNQDDQVLKARNLTHFHRNIMVYPFHRIWKAKQARDLVFAYDTFYYFYTSGYIYL